MPYTKKLKIKGQYYYYLFHTVRQGSKYLKKSKYLGKALPENIEEIKKEFLEEIKGKTTMNSSKHQKLIESLTPLERKVIPFLKSYKTSSEIKLKSKLQEVEVLRALQWLENKNIIKTTKSVKEIIDLDENGKKYLRLGLPEKRFLDSLSSPLSLEEIKKKAKLEQDEISVSIGLLKKRNLIQLGEKIKKLKDADSILILSENFLKKLPLSPDELSDEERFVYGEFKKRKNIIKENILKETNIELEPIANELIKENLSIDLIETLSQEMIKTKSYKNKKFRRYDIKINVPKIYPGKRHFVNQSIDYARRVWLDMGFKEMTGPMINTSFWNFDSLFTPQDHPARDLQDSIFLKIKKELPDKKLVEKVKEMHEKGGNGSRGWQYKWDEEKSKQLVMRTHTTVLSALTLVKLKEEDLPAKFFAIGKNFRNETVDWSHGFEFNQTEGIVVDPNANFKHLLGYLKEFFKKMGYEKVRFRPAYFPYVFLSTEIDVYHPVHKKWLELGGAGIFRPEVVIPLFGKNVSVLAWGPGFDRILMNYYEINDIRDLYKNDIKQLMEIKMWLK